MPDDRIAKCLDVLRSQVNKACPDRDKSSDGWIASAQHHAQNPSSDHEADNNGVVHALDVTNDPRHGVDCPAITETMRHARDARVRYVIHNRRIFGDPAYAKRNGKTAWTWGPYFGKNPHTAHMHVSCNYDPKFADDPGPWELGLRRGAGDQDAPPVLYFPTLAEGDKGDDVTRLQTELVKRYPLLKIDGSFGPATAAAVRQYQRLKMLVPDGIAGPYTWKALQAVDETNLGGGWQTGITATVFGGDSDVERSAYDNHRISTIEKCVALPWNFPGDRPLVEVQSGAGTEEATIEDIGPWLTDDPYWAQGARPLAEAPGSLPRGPNKGKYSNGAGIDLSPALAKALGISGKGTVSWRFKHEPPK